MYNSRHFSSVKKCQS